LPYHPIGVNVEVVGVVGPLLTEDAGDSLLESSSFLSLRDFVRFFFLFLLELPSVFKLALFSLDCLEGFEDTSFVSLLFTLPSLLSSSSLSSSEDDSELDDDDDEDEEFEEEEDDDEFEFEELDDDSVDPERDFLVLCFFFRRFLGLGFLSGSQQSQ
jgi:hypothetical protein